MNAAAVRFLGAERAEELYGRTALDFIHPEYREITKQRIENAAAHGDNPQIESLLLRLDGSTIPVEMVSVYFQYQGNDSVLAVARDISERKKMQDELIKGQKLESLGILAGGIAHDFNNILTGILGNISLVRNQLEGSGSVVRLLESCENAAIRASDLTQQLLTFARGGKPVRKLFDPAPLIRESASFVLRGSNVKCEITTADDLWSIDADAGQISQVLHNLLINATHAMPGGGVIRVAASNVELSQNTILNLTAGQYLKITIEDSGCGIPPDNLQKIFDPYFTTKCEGSGLGLSSVYSIIRRHSGSISVSSTMGVGSCFTIHLPAICAECHDVEISGTEAELSGSGRILFMDDEQIIREVATGILEFAGYQVECCADGEAAVAMYRGSLGKPTSFDAVIMDLTVPGGMGGKQAAGLILEIDPAAILIVSSGYSNDPVIADFRRYGFSGTVVKPFSADRLVGELRHLIGKPGNGGISGTERAQCNA